jgi:predicted kinase
MMCGLPGAGKDTYVREQLGDLPVVSLDDLRAEMEVDPTDNQGSVVQAGRERLREHFRKGERFVYNATNINRQRRGPILGLAADYGVRVRIVYCEAPMDKLLAQNRARAGRVPEAVIRRMSERWEMPSLTEAHRVDGRAPGLRQAGAFTRAGGGASGRRGRGPSLRRACGTTRPRRRGRGARARGGAL